MDTSAYELTGKVAVITGSTRGIGHAIAAAMGRLGAKVVVTGRRQDACDKCAADFAAEGIEALGVACEVTKEADRERLIAETVAKFGRVDILVNNAGLGGQPKKMLDMDEQYFDNYIDADLKGLYFMSKLAAAQMQAQGRTGTENPYRIVNLASAAGIKAPIGDTVYGSCKAAVAHLTRIMANELARYGILCNSVAPGYVLTDMTKDVMADEKNVAAVTRMISVRRYAQPEEIASVIAFLCSPAAGYVTGVLIPVDGGMTIN